MGELGSPGYIELLSDFIDKTDPLLERAKQNIGTDRVRYKEKAGQRGLFSL